MSTENNQNKAVAIPSDWLRPGAIIPFTLDNFRVLLDAVRATTTPSAMQPTSSASSADERDIVAKAIYDAFEYTGAGSKPSWSPLGNSQKQEEARKYAEAAIAAIVPPVVQAPIDFDEWQRNPYTIALQRSIHEDYEPRKKAEHFDDHAVDCFAKLMKAKMAKKRGEGRGGWDDSEQCTVEYLSQLLHEHVAKGDPVDVANICMMIRHYDAPIAAHVVAAIPSDMELLNKFIESFASEHGFGPGDQEIWDAARASVAAPIVATVPSEPPSFDMDDLKYAILVMSRVLAVNPLPTGNRIIDAGTADMLRTSIAELGDILAVLDVDAAPSTAEQASEVRNTVLDEVAAMISSSGLDQRSMFASRVRGMKSATPADKGNAPAEAKS